MKTYGFEEKRKQRERICPICGKPFFCNSVRRKYCYSPECAKERYFVKLSRKKAAWHRKHSK